MLTSFFAKKKDKEKVEEIPQPSPNPSLNELETRVSSIEVKLFELRNLLLESDIRNPQNHNLSKFGRRFKRQLA